MPRNDDSSISPSADDSGTPTGGVSRDWTDFGSPSAAVVWTVAAATGHRPDDLSPLNDVIDPDGLDAVLAGGPASGGDVCVRFRYEGCDVVVAGDGRTAATPVGSQEDSSV